MVSKPRDGVVEDESMHPFWAIPRLSADELRRKNEKEQKTHRFNVSLKAKQYNVVTVGDLRGQSVSMTASVSVPVITNMTKLAAGEELLIEIAPSAAPAKRKDASWKDDVVVRAKAKAKAQQKPAAAAPTTFDSEV